jgi:hypothetical protein
MKKIPTMMIVVLMLSLAAAFPVHSSIADVEFYVDPPVNSFTDSTPLHTRFNVTVMWKDTGTPLNDVFAWQITMYYNPTLLNCTKAWQPNWDPDYIFYGMASVMVPPYYSDGYTTIMDTLSGLGAKSSGALKKLAIFQMEIIYVPPPNTTVSSALNINNTDSFWSPDGFDWPTPILTDGIYIFSSGGTPAIPEFYVDPPVNSFTDSTPLHTRFNVTVMWKDTGIPLTGVFAWQILMYYDSALLNCTRAWQPVWDSDYIFYGMTTVKPLASFSYGSVVIMDTLYSGTGSGALKKLAIFEMEIIYVPPPNATVSSALNINNLDSFWSPDGTVWNTPTLTDGVYEYSSGVIPFGFKVALVPDAYGLSNNGGWLPTSGFPGTFSPTFEDLAPATIAGSAYDPIVAGGFDIVVLVQIDYVQNWLADATFRSRIENFVFNGGKLIIWDSECQNNDYSQFIYPFTENTPGQQGSNSGTLWIVEDNTLGTNDTTSASYVNTAAISGGYDIGDANVMVTYVPDWCTHLVARNLNIVVGPVQTYARYGSGLIIWNGLDMDYMGGMIANDNYGPNNLNYLWYLQLLQPWNPDNLPCGIRTSGITVTPMSSTNPTGTTHTVTATIRDNLANPIPKCTVNFNIYAGPNAGLTGTDVTNANGEAYFSWTGFSPGTDRINATAQCPFKPTVTIFDDKASKTWIQVRFTLTVYVLSTGTNQSLSGATVVAVGPENRSGVTDGGAVVFSNTQAGTYTVTASKTGYVSASVTVSLTADKSITIGLIPLTLPATVIIHPENFNLKSRGKWITCFIMLPRGYDARNIDVSSMLLNGTVPAEPRPVSLGHCFIMVKFDRKAVLGLILSAGIKYGKITLTVAFRLYDGTMFEGSDTIRAKMPGDVNCDGKVEVRDVAAAAAAYGSHPGHPRWNPMADENEDDKIDVKDLASIIINYGRKYK